MKQLNNLLRRSVSVVFAALTLTLVLAAVAQAQTTTFTYQGRLSDSGMMSGTYDLQFTLYNEAGAAITGATITRDDVAVTNGVFTVQLDFGAAFPGANRTLEISVRRGTETGVYTTLAPRQPITSTPYAIKSLNATNADTATTATTETNAQQLGGTAASNFVQTNSTAFIRNQTTQQTFANFNIDSTGTANIFNAGVQYNIGGNRILSNAGSNNLFAGVGAGSANTTGISNSFVGFNAGQANTIGQQNSFFGTSAGSSNTDGSVNSFVGQASGFNNTTGGSNSFFGNATGQANTTGANNTIIGQGANVASGALNFATALGSGAAVSTSNTIALGRSNGSDAVVIYGLGAQATATTPLCRNSANQIAQCATAGLRPEFETKATKQAAMQTQIDRLAEQIAEQKALIDVLKRLVCASNGKADVCKQP